MKNITQQQCDLYYLSVAKRVAERSRCASRKVGAVVVKNNCVVGSGANNLTEGMADHQTCPRRDAGYGPGKGLDLCPVVHAEVNAILSVAHKQSLTDATIYVWACRPCKNCAATIVQAGINRVVYLEKEDYDVLSGEIFEAAGVECVKIKEEEVA